MAAHWYRYPYRGGPAHTHKRSTDYDSAEGAMKRIRVCLFDAAHSLLEGMTNIAAPGAHTLPVTVCGDLKTMVFWKLRECHIPRGLCQGDSAFFVVDIGKPLEKQ